MWLALLLLALSPWQASAQPTPAQPEAATSWRTLTAVQARRQMVVAANPYAAEAGRDILRAGGSAVDAAIAVQLMLGLVEPQSSGLGGGAFLLHWDARTRALKSYDGRETAPAAARPDRFLIDGRPLAFGSAVRSGLSVGTPGAVRLMELAHQRHGRLPWAQLFEPAIRVSEAGFLVSPRLQSLLRSEGAGGFSPDARAYLFDAAGEVWPVGHRLRNETYATTLRRIARDGAKGFYEGPVALAITTAVIGAPGQRGDLTLADLAGYRARERDPVCVPYRDHRVCGMGPPSSGGTAIAQALMLLDGFDIGKGRAVAMNSAGLHLIAEATKLAFADRNWYSADPDFVPQPAGLVDPGYIAERRRLIDPLAPNRNVYPGLPPGRAKIALGEDDTREAAGTTHLSIIDAEGNVVAMTSSIEAGFGSRLWAAGFLLNNQLTDFSFRPRDRDGQPIANRVEALKRPRSSMAPTIVFDARGTPVVATGSPGGTRIIPYVLKSLVAIIDWQLDAQVAASLPNFGSRGGSFEFEGPLAQGHAPAAILRRAEQWHRTLRFTIGLQPFGQSVAYADMTSGLHIIVRLPDGRLEGGADPRREGIALGD